MGSCHLVFNVLMFRVVPIFLSGSCGHLQCELKRKKEPYGLVLFVVQRCGGSRVGVMGNRANRCFLNLIIELPHLGNNIS